MKSAVDGHYASRGDARGRKVVPHLSELIGRKTAFTLSTGVSDNVNIVRIVRQKLGKRFDMKRDSVGREIAKFSKFLGNADDLYGGARLEQTFSRITSDPEVGLDLTIRSVTGARRVYDDLPGPLAFIDDSGGRAPKNGWLHLGIAAGDIGAKSYRLTITNCPGTLGLDADIWARNGLRFRRGPRRRSRRG